MILIVPHEEADDIMQMLHGMDLQSYAIGEVAKLKKGEETVKLI
jgi:phosphoribosylaminoimidazole (AIR) synthetase